VANLVKPWIVRYVDAEGRRVSSDTPGAIRKEERAKKWYGENIDADWPKGKRVPLATHKATAQALLNQLVDERIRAKHGMTDRYRDHCSRPLTEQLGEYRRELELRGATPKHIGQTVNRIKALAEGCAFETLRDINSTTVTSWLIDRRQDREQPELPKGRADFRPGEVAALLGVTNQALWKQARRAGVVAVGTGKARRYPHAAVETLLARAARGNSVQTSNFYLAAFKGFCRWLVANKRIPESPVADLRMSNAKMDRRHDRRELTVEELIRLLEATRASAQTFRGLTGDDRFHIYLTACGTGFRAGELAVLRPDSFDFSGDVATVRLTARRDKARRGTTQPLPPGVAAALRAYLCDRTPSAVIWPGHWAKLGADMLRIDLAAAGVPYEVPGPDGPLFADFHSLRHSFITLMARSGVSPKQAQQLARHGDIRLTMDRYTHLGLADLSAAVGRLPALTASVPETATLQTVAVPVDDYNTLTALAAIGLTMLGIREDLVAVPVAVDSAPDGDDLGRPETKGPQNNRMVG
jgi:integrase